MLNGHETAVLSIIDRQQVDLVGLLQDLIRYRTITPGKGGGTQSGDYRALQALVSAFLVEEGFAVLDGIYRHSQDLSRSRIYPGIPEYIEPGGRGMYPYLTGSASWYLLTVVTEVFGIKGQLGDLILEPKLMPQQFDAGGRASIQTLFAGRKLKLTYHNAGRLPWGKYTTAEVHLDGEEVACERQGRAVVLPQDTLAALAQ
mgnify:CR=1 FL=1